MFSSYKTHTNPVAPHFIYAVSTQTDRRALNITLNSIGTDLTRDDRKKLYSNFGLLYPHGHHELAQAEDFDQIRSAMEKVPAYAAIFNKVGAGRVLWASCAVAPAVTAMAQQCSWQQTC